MGILKNTQQPGHGRTLAGRQLSEADGAPLCLHPAIIQMFLLIRPMNKTSDVQGTLSQENHIWLLITNWPSQLVGMAQPVVTVLGSPVI